MLFNCLKMLPGAVAHIPAEAVVRILLVKFPHIPVPRYLGYYRGSSNRHTFAVAFYDCLCLIGNIQINRICQ
ncbi:Uncharacterised protein [Mycobacteroides abscessus subsp. abscessus]|nr:Uncharacterised protein [Mycobacteroides abscessus subsp. abscessus]